MTEYLEKRENKENIENKDLNPCTSVTEYWENRENIENKDLSLCTRLKMLGKTKKTGCHMTTRIISYKKRCFFPTSDVS